MYFFLYEYVIIDVNQQKEKRKHNAKRNNA